MNTNEQLAAAIVQANERLDWIEARDGKLPDDNYATIETTVGLVRALRGATAADTVTVDRASLVAHNLEKREQIDSLQREVEALKAERDGIQQAYAEQGIVWGQDQDTIERLTAERDEWKRINDSDNRSASRRVEALAADLAASEQRAADLRESITEALSLYDQGHPESAMGCLEDVMICYREALAADASNAELPLPPLPVTHTMGTVVSVTQRPDLILDDEPSAGATTRTVPLRCHCGRGVTMGAVPWCLGCNQSAATCDCAASTAGREEVSGE